MSQQERASSAAGENAWGYVLRYQGRRILVGLVGLLFFSGIGLLLFQLTKHPKSVPPRAAMRVMVTLAVVVVVVQRIVDRGIDYYYRREGQARRGAIAEETVGEILARLPSEEHLVLHDVRTRHGNIDHIVLRRDGAIILIETKSHHGNVTLSGGQLFRDWRPFEKDIVKQVLGNIYELRSSLSGPLGQLPWIESVIVFTNARVQPWCKVKNIHVINASYLLAWMGKVRGNQAIASVLWMKKDEIRNAL